MNVKPRPNHALYIETLRGMTPEQRLLKAFELSELAKQLFLQGLKKRFPEKTTEEIKIFYRERIALCHNQNY